MSLDEAGTLEASLVGGDERSLDGSLRAGWGRGKTSR
jgi:hypothetical protein